MTAELLSRLSVLPPEERAQAYQMVARIQWSNVAKVVNERIRELREENEEMNVVMDKARTYSRQADAAWRNAESHITASVVQPILCR